MIFQTMNKWILCVVLAVLLTGGNPVFAQQVEDKPKAEQEADNDSEQDKEQQEESEEGTKPEAEDESTESERPRRRRRPANKIYTKKSESFISVFKEVADSTRDSVVIVKDGKKQIALGTVIDSNGLILTKASELRGKLSCVLPSGKSVKPKIVGIDPETDLVLLQVQAEGLSAVKIADEKEAPTVGSWLVTVGPEESPKSIGIVSHPPRKIENNVPSSAVIGIMPVDRDKGEGVRINRVMPDSPAEKSGLLVNDVIVQIDAKKISNVQSLRNTLSDYQPGDEIDLKILRGEEKKPFKLTLGPRGVSPMIDRGVRQNQMGSVLSKRRSDFPLALQHDSSLNANECGGPVVDINGKVVGMNIARDGRVSTLALPNSVVVPIINRLKTGEYLPMVVNKAKIDRIEKQLAKVVQEIGDLPEQKTKKEIEFSAGAAVEDEIQKQIKEMEAQLKALKKRHSSKKKSNRKITDSIADIQSQLNKREKKQEQLEFDLKLLKTGVK